MQNPFHFKTPDSLSAQDTVDLFVPVFLEYNNLQSPCNTFIHQSRGCGKSMIFRYMNPDCQCIALSKTIHELEYFAITIPIKRFRTNLEEINREPILIEHEFILYISIIIFQTIKKYNFYNSDEYISDVKLFYNEHFQNLLKYCGWKKEINLLKASDSLEDIFSEILSIFRNIYKEYSRNICLGLPYNGPIFSLSEFLIPLIENFKKINIFPQKPFFLLIDDADELNTIQTMILNQWISNRNNNNIYFKVATQRNYKTYKTINNSWIGSPHDYSLSNIAGIYTSNKKLYKKRVKEIIEKRLKKYCKINTTAELYFPENIETQLKNKSKKSNSLIKSKNVNYSGFSKLVEISSGVVRYFIDFASKMYEVQSINSHFQNFNFINPNIQHSEITNYSHSFFDEIEKIFHDFYGEKKHLEFKNLFLSLGFMFQYINNTKENNKSLFSFAIAGEIENNAREAIETGLNWGFLQKKILSNKAGTGRISVFILNRMLAPFFKIEVTNFSSYKLLNSNQLDMAINNPNKFIRYIKKTEIPIDSIGQLFIES